MRDSALKSFLTVARESSIVGSGLSVLLWTFVVVWSWLSNPLFSAWSLSLLCILRLTRKVPLESSVLGRKGR